MFKFQEGKTYITSSGDTISVLRRTKSYVTYAHGRDIARRKIRKDLFGEKEYIFIPSEYPDMNYFCVADDVQ